MGDKIKIIMTADTLGGVWTYAIGLCRSLQAYNFEIHLVTMGKWLSEHQNKEVRELDHVTLYESNLKLEWMEDPWEDITLAKEWIGEIYRKVQPDIMHFNNYAQVSSQWQCSILTVFHSCVLTWHTAVRGRCAPSRWNRYKAMVESALFLSDSVVFPSEAIKSQALREYGSIARAEVIYNGFDSPTTIIPEKLPVVLSAGRIWDEAKNTALLCRIAPLLTWPVKIAGDQGENSDPALAHGNVTFLGQLPNKGLLEHMREASIFMMPAKYEPFGLAVLEAAGSGCALALSAISTLQEVWGEAAVYFDPDDREDALRVVQNLIDDDHLRRTLSQKAKDKAAVFTAERMAAQYRAVYKRLLAEHNVENLSQTL